MSASSSRAADGVSMTIVGRAPFQCWAADARRSTQQRRPFAPHSAATYLGPADLLTTAGFSVTNLSAGSDPAGPAFHNISFVETAHEAADGYTRRHSLTGQGPGGLGPPPCRRQPVDGKPAVVDRSTKCGIRWPSTLEVSSYSHCRGLGGEFPLQLREGVDASALLLGGHVDHVGRPPGDRIS